MRVLNDFECTNCGAIEEHFLENDCVRTTCLVCGASAKKLLQPIAFHLPGNDPHGFPTAADKWVKKREQKMREERNTPNPQS